MGLPRTAMYKYATIGLSSGAWIGAANFHLGLLQGPLVSPRQQGSVGYSGVYIGSGFATRVYIHVCYKVVRLMDRR